MLKPIPFALAVGVFVDAFGVCTTLVPAVLALVGLAGRWLPAWLDRLLPARALEGECLAAAPEDAHPGRSARAHSERTGRRTLTPVARPRPAAPPPRGPRPSRRPARHAPPHPLG
ncbi:hypothetical protein SRB17_45020 [Streptomyces sp. RB17]|nr:hypothetical protein [Streptomyces sp. RB17]